MAGKRRVPDSRKKKRDEGGFLLIAAIFLSLFLTILLTAALTRMAYESRLSVTHEGTMQAFYMTETGLERAIAELRTDPTIVPDPGSPPNILYVNIPVHDDAAPPHVIGSYDITVYPFYIVDNWPVVPVSVIGRTANANFERRLDAEVRVVNPSAFFIFSPYDLHVASGSNVNGDIFGRDVHFHYDPVLGDITVDDDDSNADVFYMRSFHGYPHPNIHLLDGDPEQRQALTFADIDFARYEQLADAAGIHIIGDTTISGGQLSTEDPIPGIEQTASNGIVYVEGDVTIGGNVVVDDPNFDPLIIVSTGNIYISADIEYADDRQFGDKNRIGLFAGENVIINPGGANLTLQAQILVQGDNIIARGDPGTLGTFDFLGSMVVKGKDGVCPINLLAFTQRLYSYDVTLLEEELLPGMNSFVNIRSWKEVAVGAPAPSMTAPSTSFGSATERQ